jgi:hypothetical protein
MYSRPTGPGKINLNRADCTLKNINCMKFMSCILNPLNFKTPQYREMKIVEEIDENSSFWYMKMKVPLLSERDMLLKIQRIYMPDDKCLVISNSVEREDYPEFKGIIRMDMFKMSLCWQDGPDTTMIEFSSFDMKGSIPASLINMIMAASITKGMKNILDKIKKLGC